MRMRINLDMDVLRTFATGIELGSFAKAAERLGRSQSAISTQLRKLEEQVGQPLVQKAGRGLVPTAAGESLLGYARRILDLNDEAVTMLRDAKVEGWVRLGLPQGFAETWLPAVLGGFSRAHPKVRVEAREERNAVLIDKLSKGELDLALAWDDGAKTLYAEPLAELEIAWIARPDWPAWPLLEAEPLPVIAFEAPCVFRSLGVEALDRAGIAWRVAFVSPSLSGLWAAAEAGLGVTIRTAIGLPKSLRMLEPAACGLPELPSIRLALHTAEAQPRAAVARLADILRETLFERLPPNAILRPGRIAA